MSEAWIVAERSFVVELGDGVSVEGFPGSDVDGCATSAVAVGVAFWLTVAAVVGVSPPHSCSIKVASVCCVSVFEVCTSC